MSLGSPSLKETSILALSLMEESLTGMGTRTELGEALCSQVLPPTQVPEDNISERTCSEGGEEKAEVQPYTVPASGQKSPGVCPRVLVT